MGKVKFPSQGVGSMARGWRVRVEKGIGKDCSQEKEGEGKGN